MFLRDLFSFQNKFKNLYFNIKRCNSVTINENYCFIIKIGVIYFSAKINNFVKIQIVYNQV